MVSTRPGKSRGGAAWEAKKTIEEGNHPGKGSEAA